MYETHRNALVELEHLFESDAHIREQTSSAHLHHPLHQRTDVSPDEIN